MNKLTQEAKPSPVHPSKTQRTASPGASNASPQGAL